MRPILGVLLGCSAFALLGFQSTPSTPADQEKQARAVCGGCHAFPAPEILPQRAWRDEFVRMMFIRDNRLPPIGPPETVYRTVQLPPDMEQVLPFYMSRAPERLPAPLLGFRLYAVRAQPRGQVLEHLVADCRRGRGRDHSVIIPASFRAVSQG